MKPDKVGKIKNINLDEVTGELEITILVTDNKFKKKILRDLSLSGNLMIDGENIIFVPSKSD